MTHHNIRTLKVISFLVEFGLYTPIAVVYFSQVAGSYMLGAGILGITMLAAAILEVPTGIWSDKVGRRQTLIAGSWARLIAIVCYAVGGSYGWLVAGAIIEGLSRALYSGNNDALLYDTLADEHLENEYHDHLGKISSMEQIAVAIGALLGGVLASYSFSLLFWLSTIPHALKLIFSYRLTEPKARSKSEGNIFAHTREAIKLFIHNPKLRLLSITDIISESTGEVSYQFRSAFLATLWPFWAIGLLSTFVNIGSAISFYMSGWAIRRFGAEKILFVRSIWGKISGLIAYGIPNVFSPVITITPAFLYGAGQIAKNSLMQKEFSSAQRATMSSLNSLASSLGFAFMTFVIGLVADRFSPAQALFWLTVVSIPVIFVYQNLLARKDA